MVAPVIADKTWSLPAQSDGSRYSHAADGPDGPITAPSGVTVSGPIIIDSTTLRVGISGGVGATSRQAYTRTPAGAGAFVPYGAVPLDATTFDFTVASGPTYDLTISASNAGGTTNGTIVTGSTSTPVFPTGWQLDNYLPQYRPLRVITQRPEAGPHAAHLWADPDRPYDHPILVNGGAPPYYAVLQEAPPWMDDIQFLQIVGTELRPHKYYLRLYGANPTASGQPAGGWPVRYRVYGQDFGRGGSPTSYQEVSFKIQVDPSKFLYLSETGNPAGSGTITNPRNGFRGWYGTSESDNTFFGRIPVFRGGTYPVLGRTSDSIALINPNMKPQSFQGYEGESVIWDFSSGRMSFWGSGDFSVYNITTVGSRLSEGGTPLGNGRNFSFFASGSQSRIYFDRCKPKQIVLGNPAGTDYGGDNSGWIWRPNSTPARNLDWGFTQVEGDTAGPGGPNGPSMVNVSCVDYMTINQCTAANWSGQKWANAKDSGRYVCHYYSDAWDINVGTAGTVDEILVAAVGNTYDASTPSVGNEFWYCRANSDGNAYGLHADGVTGTAGITFNYCSVRGGGFFRFLANVSVTVNKCVIAGPLDEGSSGFHVSFVDCLRSTNIDTPYFDSDGNLAPAYVAANFGIRGAQIANEVI